MADCLPLFIPGRAVTRKLSVAATEGQLLAVSGSGTVAPTTAATAAWVAVAGTAGAIGDNIPTHNGGVQRLKATGAVTAGDILVPAANGTVATNAAPGAGQQVGVALTTAATGALVEVQMVR